MKNFYENLKQNNNVEFLKTNLNAFNALSDNDINLLLEDENISHDFKTIIVELCYNRINQLSFNIFINAIAYISNPDIFITNHGNKISKMNYEEIVSLIYDAYCEPECLLAMIKTEIFDFHLKNEKNNKTETKLQSFLISSKIYLVNENINELEKIGKEIETLIFECGNDKYSQDIEDVIDSYLSKTINNIDKVDVDNPIIKSCVSMINYNNKCHRLMNQKMIKFYILYRIKDLNLSPHCREIIITEVDNPEIFGDFQNSTGTLRIFHNYLETRFRPLIEQNDFTDEDALMDLLNITFFQMISHELSHVIDEKRINEYRENNNQEPFIEKVKKVDFLNYWYRNGILKLFSGDNYRQNHGKLIEENRADLFSFIDSSIQLNQNFSAGFTEILLQNFSRNNATRIINFYTEQTKTGTNIVTPMQKFDIFFQQLLPNEKDFLFSNITTDVENNEQAIINNLLMGNVIPNNVLEGILKIANGQRITTDLYSDLQSIINEACNLNVDSELDVGITKK